MKERLAILAAMAAVFCAFEAKAGTTTLDFESPSFGVGEVGDYIGPSYDGLTWSNFGIISGPGMTASLDDNGNPTGENGYANGVVSGTQVACGCAQDFNEDIDTISSDKPFTLVSGWFTAAWYYDETLMARGYSGASQLFSTAQLIEPTAPTLITFNWAGVDRVEFELSVPYYDHTGWDGDGVYFALDDLTVDLPGVPEPATWALMILGFGTVGALLRRRKAPALA